MLNLQARTALGLAMLLGSSLHAQTTADRIADLSQVPQIHETKAQRDARMRWFCDAKFGMFIHWGPCSVGQKEIGWGREANRPWDINKHGPRTSDENNPWAKIDLGAVKNVKAVVIENRPGERRTDGLVLSVSEDGQKWVKSWQAQKWEQKWLALVTRFHAGIDVPGRPVRCLKFETRGETPRPMLLQRVQVYGE